MTSIKEKFIWNSEDSKEQMINTNGKVLIPNGIQKLKDHCFFDCYYNDENNNVSLQKLIIPSTVTSIPKNCLEKLMHLTSITLPIQTSQIIIGNNIFSTTNNHFNQVLYLPSSIQKINGKKVEKSNSLSIPTTVTSLDKNCFYNLNDLNELIIPKSVKSIPNECFDYFLCLKSITIPLNKNQILCGNKIFTTPHFKQVLNLPDTIQMINGKLIQKVTSFEIPTSITSLDKNCFEGFHELKQLTIVNSVSHIPYETFLHLSNLKELYLETNKYCLIGNRLFYIEKHCLCSIPLSSSIKKVNDEEINELETFSIPKCLTKLSDYCFANCTSLKQIKGIKHIKEFGKGCFFNCPLINKNNHSIIQYYKPQSQYDMISLFQKDVLEKWSELKCDDILFDFTIDECSKDVSNLKKSLKGKSKLMFLIQSNNEEIFGYYIHDEFIKENDKYQQNITKSFQFILQSNIKRIYKPMKFKINYHKLLNKLKDILNNSDNVQANKKINVINLTSFANNEIDFLIDDKQSFKLKRFIIIQMK